MHSIKQIYHVKKNDINYIRWTVESYDGMAVVRTVDSSTACIEILIAPGCENWINSLLLSLRIDEGIDIYGNSLPD